LSLATFISACTSLKLFGGGLLSAFTAYADRKWQLELKETYVECYDNSMNLSEIVVQLKDERARLDAAIHALEGVSGGSAGAMSGGGGKRRGRPPGSGKKSAIPGGTKKRRVMSAAARKRIAAAMKARWAAAKKSGKKRL
jgi:hypothetical protein